MSRRHQIQRQWEIFRYLEAGGTPTLADLAEVMRLSEEGKGQPRQWSESTLRRDIEDLVQAGFPIVRQTRGGVRWCFPKGYRTAIPGPFLPSELMALYYARKALDAFRETPFRRSMESFLNTVEKLLPAPMREFLDRIDRRFVPYLPSMKALAAHQSVLEEVVGAADELRCVELLVQLPGRHRASWRRVDPYGVWFHLGRTLLMGYLHETGRIELLPLESIQEVRTTQDVFQLPLEIDFQSVMARKGEGFDRGAGAGREVVVRCSGEARVQIWEAVNLGWIPGASLGPPDPSGKESGNGEEVLRFSATDLSSVRAWVLSLGGGAEVLSPPELRRAVAKEVRQAQELYQGRVPKRKDESNT
ncbi:MAG: helix-turn-helix transcriptional regulator [Nitrospinota bacterium]